MTEEYWKFILITERVKDFIIDQGLKPCVLTPSHKVEWDLEWRPEEDYDDQGNYIGPPLDELEEKLKRFPFEDSGLGE
ncbi:MAG: hypothetical protein AB1725_08790 [Armatimonadota bacterium]